MLKYKGARPVEDHAAIGAVRLLALRSINCRNLAKSYGNTLRGLDYAAQAVAFRKAAKVVAVNLGLCKAIWA